MSDVLLALACTFLGMSVGIVVGFFCGEAEGYCEGHRDASGPTIIVLEKRGKK